MRISIMLIFGVVTGSLPIVTFFCKKEQNTPDTGHGPEGAYRFSQLTALITCNALEILVTTLYSLANGSMPTATEWRMSFWFIPCAVCDLFQSYFEFWVLIYLTASQFGVFYNLNIVFTAIAYAALFRVRLSATQWLCILVITIGCIQTRICQVELDPHALGGLFGIGVGLLGAQLCALVVQSIWTNRQLRRFEIGSVTALMFSAIWQLPLAAILMLATELPIIQQEGFFHGWDFYTLLLILAWCLFDFMTITVIDRMNSIWVSLIEAMALFLTFSLDILVFDTTIMASQWLACIVVISSVMVYEMGNNASVTSDKLEKITTLVQRDAESEVEGD